MTAIKLPFIQAFTARGRRFYYFRKPGCARVRLIGTPGSAEFMRAYEAALAASAPRRDIGAHRSTPGSVAGLVAAYVGSDEFKQGKHGELAVDTQHGRLRILNRFGNEHGDKPVKMLRPEHIGAILTGKRQYARRN
jgi:hypothetical protein